MSIDYNTYLGPYIKADRPVDNSFYSNKIAIARIENEIFLIPNNDQWSIDKRQAHFDKGDNVAVKVFYNLRFWEITPFWEILHFYDAYKVEIELLGYSKKDICWGMIKYTS